MPFTDLVRALVPIAASLSTFIAPVFAGQQHAYWRPTAPGPTQSPTADPWSPGNPNGWRDITGANTSDPQGNPITVAAGASLFIGATNISELHIRKSVNFKLSWVLGDPKDFRVVGAMGYHGMTALPGYVSSGSRPVSVWAGFGPPCPQWEYIEIRNTSGSSQQIRVAPTIKPTKCYNEDTSAPAPGTPDTTLEITDASFGVPGSMVGPMRITEMQIYPENTEVDFGAPTPSVFPPGTGNWTVNPVFVDPDGTPRPGGGISITSDGFGLAAGDAYALTFSMLGRADTMYSMYAFDADAGEWDLHRLDLHRTPWWEGFELHEPTDELHGIGEWQGWDNDPAFGASVTDAQAFNSARSVEITGPTDLVRTFADADSGLWVFEAWQYIPSSFISGGSGQFAGSYFVLLNTYPTTGIDQHWCVQMQFDSNDGLCKVFHGNGLSTVPVPYDTDRWVRIQSVIDLEDDWTRVYYDDALVTEYTWTGGVIGTGGGALDIAAVDLYAQGSSPIYYDDLSLLPIIPCSEADVTTQGAAPGFFGDGLPDGQITSADLNYYINAWVAAELVTADVTTQGAAPGDPGFGVPDGAVTGADLNYFVNAWIAGCP